MKNLPNETIELYWQSFLATLPADLPYRNRLFNAEGWESDPNMTDELGALIAAETKTATYRCVSLKCWK
jgi:hypothetical protein